MIFSLKVLPDFRSWRNCWYFFLHKFTLRFHTNNKNEVRVESFIQAKIDKVKVQTDKRKHWPEGSNKYIATFLVFVILPRLCTALWAVRYRKESQNLKIEIRGWQTSKYEKKLNLSSSLPTRNCSRNRSRQCSEGSLQATFGKLFKKAFRMKQDSYSKLVSLFFEKSIYAMK